MKDKQGRMEMGGRIRVGVTGSSHDEASSACGPYLARCYVYTRPRRVDAPADCRGQVGLECLGCLLWTSCTFSNEALRRLGVERKGGGWCDARDGLCEQGSLWCLARNW